MRLSRKQKEWQITWSNHHFIAGTIVGIVIILSALIFDKIEEETIESTYTYIGIPFYVMGVVGLYLFILSSMFLTLIFSIRKIQFIVPRKKLVIFIGGVTFGFGLITVIDITIKIIYLFDSPTIT